MRTARNVFANNCATCHGTDAHGSRGFPNLTDADWLHGGDSVVISAVGFVRQHYIVPPHPSDFLTLIIEMVEDVTFLNTVTIYPFPTEEVFKQAVLALNIFARLLAAPRRA